MIVTILVQNAKAFQQKPQQRNGKNALKVVVGVAMGPRFWFWSVAEIGEFRKNVAFDVGHLNFKLQTSNLAQSPKTAQIYRHFELAKSPSQYQIW